ncbi:MAG TPA: MFS transporter [Bryobacteraceae bacterium]|nr:MFS transporter [Bryobacteraceae bacterium]
MTAAEQKRRIALGFIVCLGIVSLFADMTYEGAHSIIGPYLRTLGASVAQIAFIAGLGEMLGASLRYFSGRLASRTHAYWTITMFGYAMNVIAVPGLALAGNWQMAAMLVVAERTGKALRGPARDVLLSEATGEVGHGFGFGLHAIMDQTGAVIGPLLMMVAVARSHQFRSGFVWLAAPAVGTLLALTIARILHPTQGASARNPSAQALPKVFWTYVAAAGLLAFGYADFPVLATHFENAKLFDGASIPLLYAFAMGMNGLMAFVFGRWFDRIGILALVVGILISMLSLPLGFLGGSAAAVASIGCWAAGLGAQDASLRSGISQVVSMNKRGSAFGAFNGVFGVAWFLGSAAMGLLYAHSLIALVAFGMLAQLSSAAMFLWVRKPLAEAIARA